VKTSQNLSRMLALFPEIFETGIDYVDVGCRAEVEPRWREFASLLNYVGFDADAGEISRLEHEPSRYRSKRLFPTAIGGVTGSAVLHETASPFCWSLLPPREPWLRRLECAGPFVKTGERTVRVATLDDLAQKEPLHADVLKIDSQGMELPILGAAGSLLSNVFCVEAETGFVENYVGQTVAAKLDEFMRARGFMMFDITIHRAGRSNPLSPLSVKQPNYCETVWLRDFLSAESWGIEPTPVQRPGVIKALVICWVLGFADYGVELAEHFAQRGLLSARELAALRAEEIWQDRPRAHRADFLIEATLRLLPGRLRRRSSAALGRLAKAAETAAARPHLLRRWVPGRPL
jgi:FkbM family methyltransferase